MVVVMVITTIYDLGSTLLLEQGQIALKVKISILKLTQFMFKISLSDCDLICLNEICL